MIAIKPIVAITLYTWVVLDVTARQPTRFLLCRPLISLVSYLSQVDLLQDPKYSKSDEPN